MDIDLSKYECVYISYGSKLQETPYSLLQRHPVFLGLYRNCISISIDAYPEFSMKPLDNGMDVEIPCTSLSEMNEITEKLVELLDKSNVKHVYLFNFIKFKYSDSHEFPLEVEVNNQLPKWLGKYSNNLYQWIGYRVYMNGNYYPTRLPVWVCKFNYSNPTWLRRITTPGPISRILQENSPHFIGELAEELIPLSRKKTEEDVESFVMENLNELAENFINLSSLEPVEVFMTPNVMLKAGKTRKRK